MNINYILTFFAYKIKNIFWFNYFYFQNNQNTFLSKKIKTWRSQKFAENYWFIYSNKKITNELRNFMLV